MHSEWYTTPKAASCIQLGGRWSALHMHSFIIVIEKLAELFNEAGEVRTKLSITFIPYKSRWKWLEALVAVYSL